MRVLIAGATGVLGQSIVHELTALPGTLNMRHFDCDLAATNRLRTEATDHLLAAGRAVDVRRFVAQSFAGWPFARVGGPGKTEEDPLDLRPAAGMRETLAALRHLEDAVMGPIGPGCRAALRQSLRAGHGVWAGTGRAG